MKEKLLIIIEWIDNYCEFLPKKYNINKLVDYDASIMQLVKISSAWKKLLAKYPENNFSAKLLQEFKGLSDARNYGVHDYFGIDYEILLKIKIDDMPILKQLILEYIASNNL